MHGAIRFILQDVKKEELCRYHELGDALFACETGEKGSEIDAPRTWITNSKSNKTRARPLQPRHPPARCPETQDEKQPNNNRQAAIQLK